MALYSIKQETLTDIGDALRRKHGETKWVLSDGPIGIQSCGGTGFDNLSGSNGSNKNILINVPNALKINVKIKYNLNGYEDRPANQYIKIAVGNYYKDSNPLTDDMPEDSILITGIGEQELEFEGDTITIYFGVDFWSLPSGTYGYYAECVGYGSIEVPNTYKSSEMAQAIDDIPPSPPEEAFVISGDCKYKFAGNGWNWFLDTYQDRISTENITSLEWMFDSNSNIESINFDFNCRVNTVCPVSSMFNNCQKLKAINGKIKNLKVSTMYNMFYNCLNLRYLPDFIDIDFTNIINTSYENCTNAFQHCYSLRSISENFLKQIYQPKCTGYYYAFLYNTFYNCYSLDEVTGLNPQTGKMTSNMFTYTFDCCFRVKNIIFATQDDGIPYNVSWKSQVIDLSGSVGYTYNKSYILNYNSGITADKEVTDDATYQALKNDPDWFTLNAAYSRYNHDSAVETINSLPDTSAYLATAGGTNTIKVQGQAGASTDGGAINTLTEEEIAVAAAKGWTITLV